VLDKKQLLALLAIELITELIVELIIGICTKQADERLIKKIYLHQLDSVVVGLFEGLINKYLAGVCRFKGI